MKVSVIIPCFNNSELIKQTLDSVKHQTYPDWECVIVDDGSTDNSLQIIEEYANSDVRFKNHSRPDTLQKGANSCRNFGVVQSKGNLLIFLDADDLLAEHCIENRVLAYNKEDLIVFSTANFSHDIAEASPFFSNIDLNLDPAQYRDMFLNYTIPWHVSSGLWKKEFYQKIGGFEVSLLRFQDVELHVRALNDPSISLKLDYSKEYTSFYRKSGFHQKVTLEKRKFILEQGLNYASKMKETLDPTVFLQIEGLFVYLLFRFEEVIRAKELQSIETLTGLTKHGRTEGFNSIEFKTLIRVYKSIFSKPSRFRKYFSFIVYKSFKYRHSNIGIEI